MILNLCKIRQTTDEARNDEVYRPLVGARVVHRSTSGILVDYCT